MKKGICDKFTILFFVVILAAVLLNGLFDYFFFHSQEYVFVDSILMNRRQIIEAGQILASCDLQHDSLASETLKKEYNSLSSYAHVLHMNTDSFNKGTLLRSYSKAEIAEILSSFHYSESEANERLETLAYCLQRLDYVNNYPAYIHTILNNAESLSDIGILDEVSRKNAIKAGQVFYGHDNIRISTEPDAGVKKLISHSAGDVFAIALMLICGWIYGMRFRVGAVQTISTKSNFAPFALAAAAGLVLLYMGELMVCDHFFPLGDLSRSVQSVSSYRSCPYLISVGSLLAVRTIFKILAGLTIYFFFISAFLSRRRIASGLIGTAALLVELLPSPPGMALSLYQEFHAEQLLTRYEHFCIFHELLNPALALALFSIALTICGLLLAARQVSIALLIQKADAEQTYYDEIDRRYTEARLIRHDINNHLAAVALLMDEGRIQDARDYLGKITDRLDGLTPPVKTGSTVLDAVLLGKTNAAAEQGITIQTEFLTDFSDSGIPDFDLCSVFGNLLDNAIDACKKLPANDRHILLRVREQMDMICVYCENRYLAICQENGALVTIKADKNAHGLGLRQVRHIAQKHGGILHISTEDGVFSISVLFHRAKT